VGGELADRDGYEHGEEDQDERASLHGERLSAVR
jgi:hypothetical protein